MKAALIAEAIEEFAPLGLQENWDNSGFCIGSHDSEVSGALVALDCTIELMQEAVARGVNMIITHHPLIFSGIKSFGIGNPVHEMVIYAIKHDLVVYSAHTNMDKVIGGVSGLMAEKLGLCNLSVLDEGGLGVAGFLENPVSPEEFIGILKRAFSLKHLRCSRLNSTPVKKVALCGGSGKSLIGCAVASGADIYVTGDIPYHDFFCRKGFMVADIGHYEGEIGIVELFVSVLRKKIPNFATYISENIYNPVYYY